MGNLILEREARIRALEAQLAEANARALAAEQERDAAVERANVLAWYFECAEAELSGVGVSYVMTDNLVAHTNFMRNGRREFYSRIMPQAKADARKALGVDRG